MNPLLAFADHDVIEKQASTEAYIQTLTDPTTPGYGVWQRKVAAAVHHIYREGGNGLSDNAAVFEKLARTSKWLPAYDQHFILPALTGIGAASNVLVKEAFGPLDTIKRTFGLLPAAGRLGATSALASGGAAGVLWWLLNREINDDQGDAKILRERAKLYRQLSSQIDSELSEYDGGRENMNADARNRISNISGVRQIA